MTARIVMQLGALVLLASCMPHKGWQRDDRVCGSGDPPRVCLRAEPDAPVRLRVGDTDLAPGECAFAPRQRGGLVGTVLYEGTRATTKRRAVRVRAGHDVEVIARGDELDVRRQACSATR